MPVNNTKSAILRRVSNKPQFTVVPEHAIALFDKVMSDTEVDAFTKHPGDYWARIDFWKDVILDRVESSLRGLVAVQFHEYIAALLRNDVEADPYGFDNVPVYGGEARAQYDAYMACSAGIA